MKELRLRGISTPEAANAYVPEFMADYNKRFAKPPISDHDAHRPLRVDEDLALIFTWQEDRRISKELTLRYRGRRFPFRAFDENRRVTQADIVSNKRLGDVVQKIQAKQRKQDEELLASKSVTLRRKKQIRTARTQGDGLPGNPQPLAYPTFLTCGEPDFSILL